MRLSLFCCHFYQNRLATLSTGLKIKRIIVPFEEHFIGPKQLYVLLKILSFNEVLSKSIWLNFGLATPYGDINLLDGTKQLPGPMLTNRQWGFCHSPKNNFTSIVQLSLKMIELIFCHIPRGQWVKNNPSTQTIFRVQWSPVRARYGFISRNGSRVNIKTVFPGIAFPC